MTKTEQRYREAKAIIPGGAQLLSKQQEQYAAGFWPAYHSRAKGCEVWDLDGKHYYDLTTNGIGACLLGFANDAVSEAVIRRIRDGSMCSQNPVEEVELAERLCAIHPWAEKVRFARGGGEIASVAVRIARATTGRDVVAVCGYHGWTDFYIALNLGETPEKRDSILSFMPSAGVPEELRNTTVSFNFDNTREFDSVISRYGDRLACVVVETARSQDPAPGFLEHIRAETKRVGALMILDEITIGWRNCFGGYHLKLGVTPDMAIFGKALGNGHPMSAVIGTSAAMEGANRAFISSTYWTESVGPTAALAALREMERTRVWEHTWKIGEAVMDVWARTAARNGVEISTGWSFPTLAHFDFVQRPQELKTLFTILMLEKGFLAGTGTYTTLAHTPEIVSLYETAADEVFFRISEILRKGDLDRELREVCTPDFGRLIR